MSAIGIFESLKGWLLYEAIPASWGVAASFDIHNHGNSTHYGIRRPLTSTWIFSGAFRWHLAGSSPIHFIPRNQVGYKCNAVDRVVQQHIRAALGCAPLLSTSSLPFRSAMLCLALPRQWWAPLLWPLFSPSPPLSKGLLLSYPSLVEMWMWRTSITGSVSGTDQCCFREPNFWGSVCIERMAKLASGTRHCRFRQWICGRDG